MLRLMGMRLACCIAALVALAACGSEASSSGAECRPDLDDVAFGAGSDELDGGERTPLAAATRALREAGVPTDDLTGEVLDQSDHLAVMFFRDSEQRLVAELAAERRSDGGWVAGGTEQCVPWPGKVNTDFGQGG